MMENIHSETYSLLLDTYIKDPVEKDRMFNAIENIPCIQQKAAWAFKVRTRTYTTLSLLSSDHLRLRTEFSFSFSFLFLFVFLF